MGADAEIFVFDDAAYREAVVPLIRRIVQEGGDGPALDEAIGLIPPDGVHDRPESRERVRGSLRPTSLDAFCTKLGPDLGVVRASAVQAEALAGGGTARDHLCDRADCPAAPRCPFFAADDDHDPPAFLTSLYLRLVESLCLGDSQFLGRSINVFAYDPVLRRHGEAWDGELGRLLLHLGLRGTIVGYEFGGTECVHGWLDRDESARLAALLSRLPLPDLEPTFEAMHAAWRADRDDASHFEPLSLAFVRTTALIAADEGKGVLWGNDLACGYDLA